MVRENLDDIESAAIAIGAAIGGVLKGALSDDMLRRFAELANSLEAHNLMDSFPSDFEIPDNPPELDKSLGFTLVNGNAWLPTPLYEARNRRQRKTARKKESGIVWTR